MPKYTRNILIVVMCAITGGLFVNVSPVSAIVPPESCFQVDASGTITSYGDGPLDGK